jgi:hypothetical protein
MSIILGTMRLYENIIKMNITEISCEDRRWMKRAQDDVESRV